MKIALITDTHFGARNDNRVMAKHHKRFYDEVFFPEIDAREIKHIIHLGDVTDRRKYINYLTAEMLEETFMAPVFNRGIKIDIILGNHDCFHKNTNAVNSMRQLYGTSVYDNLHVHENEPVVIDCDGTDIMLVPWISPDNQEASLKALAETKAQVVMGHFSIEGFDMMRGIPCDHGFKPSMFDKFDVVYSGHFHHPSTQGSISYLGAPYEMNWSDAEGRRGFHIFDTETRTVEFIENPFRIFHKLHYSDTDLTVDDINALDFSSLEDSYVKVIVGEKNNPYLFDIFTDALEKCGPAEVKIVDDHQNFTAINEEELIDEAQDTPTIMANYVQALETVTDKDDLINLLRDLHREAINQ